MGVNALRFNLCLTLFALCIFWLPAFSADRPPNIVLILTDDQGYGDLGSFGSQEINTPALDRLAREGAKLTSFYMAAPVCTPSRAAIMTGSYPKRVSMATGSSFFVLLAADPKGLHPEEITIAEILKDRGYATGIFGKWHLGDQPAFLPTRQGFDEFFGIPYSHDIHPYLPPNPKYQIPNFPPLPLLQQETVIEAEPDATYLTRRLTERAVEFIEEHRHESFFLYMPHPMPHAPHYASPPFMQTVSDKTKDTLAKEDGTVDYHARQSLYPHVISEIDWSVAQIVATLKKHGLDENTLLIFTSDNGPTTTAGSAGPLRGHKGTVFEGGMRVPAIAWWPGHIPAALESDQLLTAMDLLPTFAKLAGANIPTDRVIDGKNIWPVLSGKPGAQTPHQRFFYYRANELLAIRSGPWKYHRAQTPAGDDPEDSSALYHLGDDIGETNDVSDKHPEIVQQLRTYMAEIDKELGPGDELSQQCRPAGRLINPKALALPTAAEKDSG